MRNTRCENCEGSRSCAYDNASWVIIIVGLISTVAIRVVTIFMDINPIIGKIFWYIGVIGFVIFFVYKYNVFKQRAQIIDKRQLVDKLNKMVLLEPEDYKVISIILCNIRSNKERINFFFIFIASFVSLIIAVYFDFLR